jgi:hypothetical protein
MRNLNEESPNLFSMEGVLAEAATRGQPPTEERRSENLAREFVKWCCSFGSDFRNSPDAGNLRFWCEKTRLKLKDAEQKEVLADAQRLFGKKLEQHARKQDASLPQMNTMSE